MARWSRRQRLRALTAVLDEQTEPWANHDVVGQSLARATLDELSELISE